MILFNRSKWELLFRLKGYLENNGAILKNNLILAC